MEEHLCLQDACTASTYPEGATLTLKPAGGPPQSDRARSRGLVRWDDPAATARRGWPSAPPENGRSRQEQRQNIRETLYKYLNKYFISV